MRRSRLFCIAMTIGLSSAASSQGFDDKSVVALHREGLGDGAIIAKINGLSCTYDVSTDGLIALKRAGVSDDVIAAMVTRCSASSRARDAGPTPANPASAHRPGIYVMQERLNVPQMVMMRPSKASGIKVTGNGSILLPYVGKLVLPDEHSRVVVNHHHPIFYFYFPPGDRRVSDFGTPNSVAAQSPDEFTLVHFTVKKNEREVGIGKISVYSSARGIDPKEAIRFDSSEIGESAFKVSASRDLEPGEYAFVLTGANGAARVYDFTVQ